MKLTPLDIRHREFTRGMRGYAAVEVDEFLDEGADEYERLFKENIDLRERVESLEEKVAGYKRIEETLQKTLINAQASAEEQKQNATKQAQLILQDAELKARQMVNEAYSERQSVEQAVAQLKGAESDFRFKFRQLLEGYVEQLGGPSVAAKEEERKPDFAQHAEAIKEAIAREAVGQTAARGVGAKQAPPAGAQPEAESVAKAAKPPTPPQEAKAAPPPAEPAESEVTVSKAASAGAPEPKPAAPATTPEADEKTLPGSGRMQFGENDGLLADVDSGVNENEFKW